MKQKICMALLSVLICTIFFNGCETSENKKDSSLGELTDEIEYDFVELSADYSINADGTYNSRNTIFKYKLEVVGLEGGKQITYVILTNDKKISFEEVASSMKSAELNMETPEFVLLGWYIEN